MSRRRQRTSEARRQYPPSARSAEIAINPMNSPKTLFSKIWDEHVIADLGDGLALLHVDRHLLHDLNAMKSLKELRERGYAVRNPELTAATPDHGLSTQPGCLVVCGDSHTCTHGGIGALGFGLGRSEVIHVLATQTLYQKKPRQMRIRFEGALGR